MGRARNRSDTSVKSASTNEYFKIAPHRAEEYEYLTTAMAKKAKTGVLQDTSKYYIKSRIGVGFTGGPTRRAQQAGTGKRVIRELICHTLSTI